MAKETKKDNKELKKDLIKVEKDLKKMGNDVAKDDLKKVEKDYEMLGEDIETVEDDVKDLGDKENTTKKKKSKLSDPVILSLIALTAVLLVALVMFGFNNPSNPAAGEQNQSTVNASTQSTGVSGFVRPASHLASDSPFKGNPNAPVTIVEFSDFQCPWCAEVNGYNAIPSRPVDKQKIIPRIIKDFVDTGKAIYVFRHFPLSFHTHAQKAAEAAECANEQGKFWEMHDMLFEKRTALGVDNLKKYAEELGLDTDKFNKCLDSDKYASRITRDIRVGQNAGVTGTPSLFVNGKKIQTSYQNLAKAIEREYALATGGEVKEEPSVALTVVTDDSCGQICDASLLIKTFESQVFPTTKTRVVDYSTEEGKKLVEDLGITILPAFIYGPNVTKTDNYANAEPIFNVVGKNYIVKMETIPSQISPRGLRNLHAPKPGKSDHVKGTGSAALNIIEFGDFQCPYCAEFEGVDAVPQLDTDKDKIVSSIVKDYVETGKANFYFKHFPLSFHSHAQKAAEAAECAGEQGKFWEYHDVLFKNQNALDVDSLKKYAADLGLNADQFNKCLDTDKYLEKVQNDLQEGTSAGVTGTPGVYVGQILISGAQPYEVFKEVIDSQLKAAS